jgi:hypothetical protein
MNDLSNSSDPSGATAPAVPQQTGIPTGAKEVEPGSLTPQEGLRDATGRETELSPEVSSAGVKVHPTTVSIPPPMAGMGVKPTGQNIPVQTTSTVVLPLTDDQIAVGLHQSITNSVRWLAAWCVRRLKQVHIVLKNVHGKLLRTKV